MLARLRGVNPFEHHIQAHIICAPEILRAHFLGKAVHKETLGFGFRRQTQEAGFFGWIKPVHTPVSYRAGRPGHLCETGVWSLFRSRWPFPFPVDTYAGRVHSENCVLYWTLSFFCRGIFFFSFQCFLFNFFNFIVGG